MNRKASVQFIIKKVYNDYFTGFKFLGNTIDSIGNNHEYDIPQEKFNGTNNYFTTAIELFNQEKAYKKYLINIYICKNIFHIYLSKDGFTYEFIFLDEFDFKDLRKINTGFQFDDNGNKYRIRISVINYNLSKISFNNWTIIPHDYCPKQDKCKDSCDSFQLSIYSKTQIICKPNHLFDPNVYIQDFFEKYNKIIDAYYTKWIKLLKSENFNLDILNSPEEEQKKINADFNKINLHKSKSELELAFNDEKYFEFFYKILINKLLVCGNSNIKSIEDLNMILNSFENFKNILAQDKDLKIYQKVFALIQYNYIYRKYNCTNTYYIKLKDAQDKSILKKAIEFHKKFISELDEESPVFFKLLEINSKFGYYEGNPAYNLSLLNVQDIQEHIMELIPEVIYLFYSDSNTKAFTFSMTGDIAINKKFLFQKYEEMDLVKSYDKKYKLNADNISMTIARYLMHEACGHAKFRNKSGISTGTKSPTKCVSEGKIKSLTYLSNKSFSVDLIKIFSVDKSGKGDSGHYLETAFGKYKEEYVIIYFDRIKNVGKLLKYPQYFVKKDLLPILQEYLVTKYTVEKNKIIYDEDEQVSIEDEILVMRKHLEKELSLKKTNDILHKKQQSYINTIKDDENTEEEHTANKLEENELESSFTEENVLKENIGFPNFSKEEKNIAPNFLMKKRINIDKIQTKDSNDFNNKELEFEDQKSSVEKLKEKKKQVNPDSDSEIDLLDKFDHKITYDDYIESEDDEACI